MVIRLEAFERNVGNRGSKSVMFNNLTVKEQRVDGKRVNLDNNKGLQLRCTLKNFERNLVIKVLPNLSMYRNYTTASLLRRETQVKTKSLICYGIYGCWGLFYCSISNKVKNGYSITPRFKIALHKKDLLLLEQLKTFFDVGSIQSTGKNRDSFEYIVKSLKELTTVIIPHFDRYPLITQKKADYVLFKLVVDSIVKKEHLSDEGLLNIVNMKASINRGLSTQLKVAFPQSKPTLRPVTGYPVIPHPQWIAGFTAGDGSFIVLIRQLIPAIKVNLEEKFRIVLRFVLSQDKRDKQLMVNMINYFNCGRLVEYDNMVDFHVESNQDNFNIIIPFFIDNNILGVKAEDFKDWVKIANILKIKGFVLNKSDVQEICKIKSGMNRGRV